MKTIDDLEALARERRALLEGDADGRAVRAALAQARPAPLRRAPLTPLLALAAATGLGIWTLTRPTMKEAVVVAAVPTATQAPNAPRRAVTSTMPAAVAAAPPRSTSLRTPRRTQRQRVVPVAAVTPPVDELDVINGQGWEHFSQRWATLPEPERAALAEAIARTAKTGDTFVRVPVPPIAALESSAAREALYAYQKERAIVDARLQHKLTLGVKGIAFSELCAQLSKESGIEITAARTVADDKLTLFCKNRPLRELMAQITALFGFTWERTGSEGEFKYRLTQPLRAQFLEEELRNKDRDEALLDLDRQMEKYKKYLDLSPEQARELAVNATGEDKKLLDRYANFGWGPTQLYFGLGSDDLAALRNGNTLRFGSGGMADEALGGATGRPNANGTQALPANLRQNMLSSMNNTVKLRRDEGGGVSVWASDNPEHLRNIKGQTPQEFGGVDPTASLNISRDELGRYSLNGGSGGSAGGSSWSNSDALGVGLSPSARKPNNAADHAAEKNDPKFKQPLSLTRPDGVAAKDETRRRITSADALEALYKATGKDIIADYFTRLAPADEVLPSGKPTVFETLNRLADGLRFRWAEKDGFLTFRTASFFNDRPKEVPNRLLERWKQRHATGTPEARFDNCLEIARLTDTQLDSADVTEGAKLLYGLDEWAWVKSQNLRTHWRLFEQLTNPVRTAARTSKGATLIQVSPRLRQEYFATLLGEQWEKYADDPVALERLNSTLMRVELTPNPETKEPSVTFFYQVSPTVERTLEHKHTPNGMSISSKKNN